jgi:hypothetical protein
MRTKSGLAFELVKTKNRRFRKIDELLAKI